MGLIKVERLDVNINSNGQTVQLQNDVGNVNRAFVRITGASDHSSAGLVGNTGNLGPNSVGCGVQLTNTNELTFYITNGTVKMMVEVWRYEGSSGGEYEFIVRDRSSLVLLGGSTNQTATVSGLVNRNKAIPFHCGYKTVESSVSIYNAVTLGCHINTSNEIVFSRNNTGGTKAVTAYYEVVEFVGSSWNVGHGISTNHDSSLQVITLNTDSTGTGGSTFDVIDWETAMIIEGTMEGDSFETGLSDCLACIWPHTNTNQVNFSIKQGDTNAANDGVGYFHVLQADDLLIKRSQNVPIGEGNNTYGYTSMPIGTPNTDLENLSIEWFVDTNGTGTAHARSRLNARIFNGQAGIGFNDGDSFDPNQYSTSTKIILDFSNVTFPSSPSGILFEAGGTGYGTFVGYNDSGEFIVRGGSGGSVNPSNCARIVVPTSTYDFSNKTGRLLVKINPATDSAELSFDENTTGSWDYQTNITAATSWPYWSGSNLGAIGNWAGNSIAGSETTTYNFNGTIGLMSFSQTELTDLQIQHWVHRSGNNVVAYYGVADLTNLEETPIISNRRIILM